MTTSYSEAVDNEQEAAEAFDRAWEAKVEADHAVKIAEAHHRHTQEVLGRETVKARAAGTLGVE